MKLMPVVVSMIVSTSLSAQEINLKGTISHSIKPIVNTQHNAVGLSKPKEIKLLKVELSPKAKSVLAKKAHDALAHNNQFAINISMANSALPAATQLGMNGVPVLDQGEHGSCVTFAATAAVDAGLGKGDYVSQLCQLQLGNYLATNGYGPSGWDGSYGRLVLNQMESFGIVNKTQEAEVGCGDLNQYPLEGPDPESFITPVRYHQISEPLNTIEWASILDPVQAMDRVDTNRILHEVKSALSMGDRVTFAVLLLDFDLGFVGAVGTNNSTYDTWVLTPEIARDVYLRPDFGGHEMVITGYDDKAIAIDDKGQKHRGLLTLRNSWGDSVGDNGDFYMSYDYFKLLAVEAHRINAYEADDDSDDIEKK